MRTQQLGRRAVIAIMLAIATVLAGVSGGGGGAVAGAPAPATGTPWPPAAQSEGTIKAYLVTAALDLLAPTPQGGYLPIQLTIVAALPIRAVAITWDEPAGVLPDPNAPPAIAQLAPGHAVARTFRVPVDGTPRSVRVSIMGAGEDGAPVGRRLIQQLAIQSGHYALQEAPGGPVSLATTAEALPAETPILRAPVGASAPPAFPAASPAPVGPGPSVTAVTVTVKGAWAYHDKAGHAVAVPYARVEIWDYDPLGADQLLGTTYTAQDGTYQATVSSGDIGGPDLYVTVATTDDRSVAVRSCTNLINTCQPVLDGLYHAETTRKDNQQSGSVDFGRLVLTGDNAPAWYIYDFIANHARAYLKQTVGWEGGVVLPVYWTPTSVGGTYYQSESPLSARAIHLIGLDRWDSDVILHEYGHFVMDRVFAAYPSHPNCSPHDFFTPSSTGCAWTEGWADFFQAAVQGDRFYSDTEDTTGPPIDFESPNAAVSGPSIEGAIAASLWDIFDGGAESWDTLQDGFAGIWRIFAAKQPRDIDEFENAWLNSANGHNQEVQDIFYHHGIGAPTVDVVLIIDSSGSMSTNDPGKKRLEAAIAYLNASQPGDAVGIVDFDSTAKLASPLLLLPNNTSALSAVIKAIDASGGTDVGAGVQQGCDALRATLTASARKPNPRKAAILLTDGDGDFAGQDRCFSDQQWPIFAFGFGQANDALLQQIAARTAGEYQRLETIDLVCEFQRVRAKIAGQAPGPCLTLQVQPKATVTRTTTVAPNQAQITFATSWTGSDIVLSLTAPSGRTVTRGTAAPDVTHEKGAAFEVYTVRFPEPGQWQLSLYGADVPPQGEKAVLSVTSLPRRGQDFCDIGPTALYRDAILTLAEQGVIRGYANGCFGPGDSSLRAQMAALIARAVGWDAEDWATPFPDRGPVDADLWRNVGTLAHYNVARGYQDGTYRPTEPVLQVQVVSFIARALVARGYWAAVTTDDPALYPNVPLSSGHRLDLLTYYRYAGEVPATNARAAWDGPNGWDVPATRGWFAQTLWLALRAPRVP